MKRLLVKFRRRKWQVNGKLLQECLDRASIAIHIADRDWLIDATIEDKGKGATIKETGGRYRLNWQVFIVLTWLKIDRKIDTLQAVKLLFPGIPEDPAKILAGLYEMTSEHLEKAVR